MTASAARRRAVQIEATCALIGQRVSDSTDLIGGHSARMLLLELTSTGIAHRGQTGGVTSPPVETLTMYGTTAVADSAVALTLLRNWETKARREVRAIRTPDTKRTKPA